jgi:hypothetical protein
MGWLPKSDDLGYGFHCRLARAICNRRKPVAYCLLPRYHFPVDLMTQPYVSSSGGIPPSAPTDPVLRAAWREALVVFTLWGAALIWSVGYCALFAYPPKDQLAEAAAKLTFTLGFPTWVFWGIVVPWVLCAIVSFFISRFVICDADLGIDPDEALKEIIDG